MAKEGDQSPASSNGELAGDIYALVVYLHSTCNRDLLEAINREQLSFSQLQLLERLRGGRIRPTIREAASILHLSHAATSRIVDQLARRGLVRREDDENDYRAKRIVITERGEAAISRLHAARHTAIACFAQQLTERERRELEKALQRLLERQEIAAHRPVRAA